jgi:hypothetical protein
MGRSVIADDLDTLEPQQRAPPVSTGHRASDTGYRT